MTMFRSLGKGVPVVGAPIVHEWRPIVTFSCSCGKGDPLLITSQATAAVCKGCGAGYALETLSYNRHANPHDAQIGIMKIVSNQAKSGSASEN